MSIYLKNYDKILSIINPEAVHSNKIGFLPLNSYDVDIIIAAGAKMAGFQKLFLFINKIWAVSRNYCDT